MKSLNLDGIEEAKKPIFFCSFGKDSAVVLHAIQPWIEKTMVVFLDCGGVFPDVVEWAAREGAKMPKFMHVHAPGNIWDDIRTKGWSVDVELADMGRHSDVTYQIPIAGQHKTRVWTQCVNERFWMPGFVFTQMYQPDLFISGEKQSDRPYANDWDSKTFGVPKALRPIFDWEDSDAWEYLDAHNIELAPTYRGRQSDRRDCYLCFGHGLTANRIQYLKDSYPELYNKVFFEEGMSEVVPVMIEQLEKNLVAWKEIWQIINCGTK
jgi:hypothetical protein